MTDGVYSVPQYDDVSTAARVMRNHRIHRVVVTHEKKVVGMLTSFDLLKLVEEHRYVAKNPPTVSSRKGSKRRCRKPGGPREGDPVCRFRNDTVSALRGGRRKPAQSSVMVEHDVHHLPVQDQGTLVGILTDRDLKRALDPDLRLPPKEELFVDDIYEPEPYVVDGREPLDSVLDYMATHHIGSALVAKNEKLVGIVTTTDACRLFCEHLRSVGPQGTSHSAA